MSFPQRHPLCGPGANTAYDYTLGLETAGAQASIHGSGTARRSPHRGIRGHRLRRVSQSGGRGEEAGKGARRECARLQSIGADAEASLPLIIDEVKRQLTPDQKTRIQERATKHASANHEAHVPRSRRQWRAKRAGWNGVPISTARIYAELWPLIMNEDWCLASPSNFSGGHNAQLWDHDKPYSYLGGQGAGGMGYGAPASVGAALAAQGTQPHRHQHPDRWRSELRSRSALDGRASQTADADRHAQQSRVASGIDVRRIHGRRTRTRRRPSAYRQHSARSFHRLHEDGRGIRYGRRRPD